MMCGDRCYLRVSVCRNALCTEQLSTYLNDSDCIVSWAGCVQHAEGFGVSLSLGCATFPFMALLTCVSRGVNVVEKITGVYSVSHPSSILSAALFSVWSTHSHIPRVHWDQRISLHVKSSVCWRAPWTETVRS